MKTTRRRPFVDVTAWKWSSFPFLFFYFGKNCQVSGIHTKTFDFPSYKRKNTTRDADRNTERQFWAILKTGTPEAGHHRPSNSLVEQQVGNDPIVVTIWVAQNCQSEWSGTCFRNKARIVQMKYMKSAQMEFINAVREGNIRAADIPF